MVYDITVSSCTKTLTGIPAWSATTNMMIGIYSDSVTLHAVCHSIEKVETSTGSRRHAGLSNSGY